MRVSWIFCFLVMIGNQLNACSSANNSVVDRGADASGKDDGALGISKAAGIQKTAEHEVWVDCDGEDGSGTQKSKFNNLFSAQREVRERLKNESRRGHVYVNVVGTCRLTQPLVIGEADSGTSTSQVIWRGEARPGTASSRWARILGSSRVTFDRTTEPGKSMWEAIIPPEGINGRDLYITTGVEGQLGMRAFRRAMNARSPEFKLDGKRFLNVGRDTTCSTAMSPFKLLPDRTGTGGAETLTVASGTKVPAGTQLVLMRAFGMERFPVSDFLIPSRNPQKQFAEKGLEIPIQERVRDVVCSDPYSGWGTKAPPWTAWFENLANKDFMDQPGEWALHGGKALYISESNRDPRFGELAHQKNLISFDGAKYVTFMDFEMGFTTWYNNYAYKAYRQTSTRTFRRDEAPRFESEPAAIQLKNSNNITIQKNAFRHLGGSGIQLVEGSNSNVIIGNLMLDVGITAIEVDARAEVMARGNQTLVDKKRFIEKAASNNDNISNNFIAKTGEKDWGGMGVLIGFAQDLNIMNNKILKTSYAGISSSGTLRNCWTPEAFDPNEDCWNRKNIKIEKNRVEQAMARSSDGGAIYVNGQQPGTTVINNIIIMDNLSNDPDGHFVTGLYFDTGSTGITAMSNKIPDPLGKGIHFNRYANDSVTENAV
ncbi:MAG: hypothetical protein RI953_501, partial [Pseudomonadota bacterium]